MITYAIRDVINSLIRSWVLYRQFIVIAHLRIVNPIPKTIFIILKNVLTQISSLVNMADTVWSADGHFKEMVKIRSLKCLLKTVKRGKR